MINDLKVMLLSFGILKAFDRVVLKFNDLTAADTHKMVMMFSPLRPFVKLLSVTKVLLL